MLSKADIEKIAKITKIPLADLTKAIDDTNEVALTIPDVQTFTPEELTTRDESQKKIHEKEGEKIGEVKGKELAIKVFKNKLGITDDSKDPDVIAAKAVEKMNGDQALKEQVELLTKDKQKLEREKSKIEKTLQEKESTFQRISVLPKNLNLDALTQLEHVELISKNLEFTADGVKLNGEILRNDHTKAALTQAEAVKHFYETMRPGLLVKENDGGSGGSGGGGRGGKDEPGGGTGGIKTLKDAQLKFQAANPGKSLSGEEFDDFLQTVLVETKGELDYTVYVSE